MTYTLSMLDGRTLSFDETAGTLTNSATGLLAGTFILKNAQGTYLFRIDGIEYEAAFSNGDPHGGSPVWYDILPWPHEKTQRVTVGHVEAWK
ncbi:MAG: hypothetical protein AABZ39_05740 [Spirochaetota bacterium]